MELRAHCQDAEPHVFSDVILDVEMNRAKLWQFASHGIDIASLSDKNLKRALGYLVRRIRTMHHFNSSDEEEEAVDSYWSPGRGVFHKEGVSAEEAEGVFLLDKTIEDVIKDAQNFEHVGAYLHEKLIMSHFKRFKTSEMEQHATVRSDKQKLWDFHTIRQMLTTGSMVDTHKLLSSGATPAELLQGNSAERADDELVELAHARLRPMTKYGMINYANSLDKLDGGNVKASDGITTLEGGRSDTKGPTRTENLRRLVAKKPWRSHLFHYFNGHKGPNFVVNRLDYERYKEHFKDVEKFGRVTSYHEVNLRELMPDEQKLVAHDRMVMKQLAALKDTEATKLSSRPADQVDITHTGPEYANVAALEKFIADPDSPFASFKKLAQCKVKAFKDSVKNRGVDVGGGLYRYEQSYRRAKQDGEALGRAYCEKLGLTSLKRQALAPAFEGILAHLFPGKEDEHHITEFDLDNAQAHTPMRI